MYKKKKKDGELSFHVIISLSCLEGPFKCVLGERAWEQDICSL